MGQGSELRFGQGVGMEVEGPCPQELFGRERRAKVFLRAPEHDHRFLKTRIVAGLVVAKVGAK